MVGKNTNTYVHSVYILQSYQKVLSLNKYILNHNSNQQSDQNLICLLLFALIPLDIISTRSKEDRKQPQGVNPRKLGVPVYFNHKFPLMKGPVVNC
jgi:hypothetical protein